MGGPEYARYVGIKSLEPVGVFLPGCPDSNYPGGAPFDPLGYSRAGGDADAYVAQQVRAADERFWWGERAPGGARRAGAPAAAPRARGIGKETAHHQPT